MLWFLVELVARIGGSSGGGGGSDVVTRGVVVLYASGDMAEEVGRDEEDVYNPASSVQAYERKLICQANREGDMVGEWEAEK